MHELTTIPLNPQALTYILHTLSLWKLDNVELQAKYKYTDFTNTHFLLIQPATLFEYVPFQKKISAAILKFYELFPNEGIVLTDVDKVNMTKNGADILTKEGFHLSVEMMQLILSSGVVETDIPEYLEVVEEISIRKNQETYLQEVDSSQRPNTLSEKNIIPSRKVSEPKKSYPTKKEEK